MKHLEKRYLVAAFSFLIAGLAAGVFYREFSRSLGYVNAYTPLGLVHPHFLVLGMIMMILIGLLTFSAGLSPKWERIAFSHYAAGVAATGLMLLIRGIFDVIEKTGGSTLPSWANGIISGCAGLSHIVLAFGLVVYFVLLIKGYRAKKAPAAQ